MRHPHPRSHHAADCRETSRRRQTRGVGIRLKRAGDRKPTSGLSARHWPPARTCRHRHEGPCRSPKCRRSPVDPEPGLCLPTRGDCGRRGRVLPAGQTSLETGLRWPRPFKKPPRSWGVANYREDFFGGCGKTGSLPVVPDIKTLADIPPIRWGTWGFANSLLKRGVMAFSGTVSMMMFYDVNLRLLPSSGMGGRYAKVSPKSQPELRESPSPADRAARSAEHALGDGDNPARSASSCTFRRECGGQCDARVAPCARRGGLRLCGLAGQPARRLHGGDDHNASDRGQSATDGCAGDRWSVCRRGGHCGGQVRVHPRDRRCRDRASEVHVPGRRQRRRPSQLAESGPRTEVVDLQPGSQCSARGSRRFVYGQRRWGARRVIDRDEHPFGQRAGRPGRRRQDLGIRRQRVRLHSLSQLPERRDDIDQQTAGWRFLSERAKSDVRRTLWRHARAGHLFRHT